MDTPISLSAILTKVNNFYYHVRKGPSRIEASSVLKGMSHIKELGKNENNIICSFENQIKKSEYSQLAIFRFLIYQGITRISKNIILTHFLFLFTFQFRLF